MTARRAARARLPLLERPSAPSAVPAALAIGRCVEVWAEDASGPPLLLANLTSAKRRFERARDAWAAEFGAGPTETQDLIPNGAPWSVTQTRRNSRWSFASASVADLPALRDEAEALFVASIKSPSLRRAYLRKTGAR